MGAYSLYVTLFRNAEDGEKNVGIVFSRQPPRMEANRTDAMSKDKQDVQVSTKSQLKQTLEAAMKKNKIQFQHG